MRLIDADAFELNMQNEWERNEISNGDWIRFREMINDEPTIDAVTVVRCKDCRYYDLAKNEFNGSCNRQYATFHADDFCSYGERKDGR